MSTAPRPLLCKTMHISVEECQDFENEQTSSIQLIMTPDCEIGDPRLLIFDGPSCDTHQQVYEIDGGEGVCVGLELSPGIGSVELKCLVVPDNGPGPSISPDVLGTASSATCSNRPSRRRMRPLLCWYS
ncbi:hypothetical protein GGS21DRAFT_496704 [Xylaria nigripes]|nr:hypothetical protein GGS21DRAFT_496704 [Xylaria nigripes]